MLAAAVGVPVRGDYAETNRYAWQTRELLRVFDEQGRLADSRGQVEYVRSQSIIRRHLKRPPAVVLDVGGAACCYACWLAREGYQVHLVTHRSASPHNRTGRPVSVEQLAD